MTISERIFERLIQISMTQKEFSEKTGIKQSAISEWKKKKSNPSSDKIMIICSVLDVTQEWLLSGVDAEGVRNETVELYTIEKKSDLGHLVEYYNKTAPIMRERLMGYAEACASINEAGKKSN